METISMIWKEKIEMTLDRLFDLFDFDWPKAPNQEILDELYSIIPQKERNRLVSVEYTINVEKTYTLVYVRLHFRVFGFVPKGRKKLKFISKEPDGFSFKTKPIKILVRNYKSW
jgi:hypothetical protein